MLDQVLELFAIQPEYDLDIMKPGQSLTDVTCNVLQGLAPVLEEFRPDVVLMHGDTTTTMAASLAAYYQKIPVGHVEAGLRTGNIYSPWPEEMNRRLAGAISRFHFAPTQRSAENLLREGVATEAILVTGNTVIDALLGVVERVRTDAGLQRQLAGRFAFLDPGKRLILVTGHRRENFGEWGSWARGQVMQCNISVNNHAGGDWCGRSVHYAPYLVHMTPLAGTPGSCLL